MDVFEKIRALNMECMDTIYVLDGLKVLIESPETGCIMSAKIILEQLGEKIYSATSDIDSIVRKCQSAGGEAE